MSWLPAPLRWFLAGGVSAAVAGLWALSRPRPAPSEATMRTSAEPPPLPPGRLVPIPGRGEHLVREAGSGHGPTIVLIHGWMFPADLYWFQVIDGLAADARVVTMDHRGHGRGPRPATPFRLVDVADDVAAVLRELGDVPAILVGHSMGGPVAQLVWQRHPDVVAGLVLCATSASLHATTAGMLLRRGMAPLALLLRIIPRHVLGKLLVAQAEGRLPVQITRMISSETPPEVRERLPWMLDEFSRASVDDLAEAGRELGAYDARGWITTVDVPSVVVRTNRDRLVPPARQTELAAVIPGARLIDVDLDHDGHLAHPEVFVPALREAIDDIRRRLDA